MHHPDILILYNWKNMDAATLIEQNLACAGIALASDIHGYVFKAERGKFIEACDSHDFILLLISDDYLRSPHSMYELTLLYANPTARTKLIPIVLDDAGIFDARRRENYAEYWSHELEQLRRQSAEDNIIIDVSEMKKDIVYYNEIRDNIAVIMDWVANGQHITWQELTDNYCEPLLRLIGLSEEHVRGAVSAIRSAQKRKAKHIAGDKRKSVREYLEHAIALNPVDKEAYHNLADLLQDHFGEYEKAKEYYLKAIEIMPDDIEANHDYAILLQNHLHDYATAREYYERVLEISPKYVQARYNLAILLYRHLNDLAIAGKHYREACSINPEFRSEELDRVLG